MAIAFDGTNDEVDFGALAVLAAPTNLTVSYWVQPKTGIAALDAFVNKKSANGTGWHTGVHTTTTTSTMFMTSAGTNLGTLASALTIDQWDHFVWVYDGAGAANADRLKLWMNGVAQTLTFTGTIPATNLVSDAANVRYGRNAQNTLFTACCLEHVMVWTRSLTAAEASAQHALSFPVNSEGLQIWTPLLGDHLTLLPDYSGNGFNGTGSGVTATVGSLVAKSHDDALSPTRNAQRTGHSTRNHFRRLSALVPFRQSGYHGGKERL